MEPKVSFFSLEGTLLLSKSQMGRIGTYWLQKFNWLYKCAWCEVNIMNDTLIETQFQNNNFKWMHKCSMQLWVNSTVLFWQRLVVNAIIYCVCRCCLSKLSTSNATDIEVRNVIKTHWSTPMKDLLGSGVHRKFSLGGVHSVADGGHLYLVCAVCDVTIWRHIHVFKRSLLTKSDMLLHTLPLFL